MSLDEYLSRERVAEGKHEYWNGWMVALSDMLAASGDMIRHSTIGVNLSRALGNRLHRTDIQIFGSDLRVLLPDANSVVYPDATAFVGRVETVGDENDLVQNPHAIFEVLSSATEAVDRGAKFEAYREISTLGLYVLISHHHPLVEVYERRNSDGSQWLYTPYARLDAIARLPALGIELALSDLYENVEFPPEDPLYAAMLREQEAAYAIS